METYLEKGTGLHEKLREGVMMRLGKDLRKSWKTEEKLGLRKCVARCEVLGG